MKAGRDQNRQRLQPGRPLIIAAGAVMMGGAVFLFIAEKRRPLRQQRRPVAGRTVRNLAMGGMSMAVVAVVQRPITDALTERVSTRRWGASQRLPVPAWARDAIAFLLLDYTMYVWHVLTHKVPQLWRFHLVHHVDQDMDTTTALRFHAIDMAISIPWRAAQVVVCGVSPRALLLWQSFFFTSIVFHHSNLRIPLRLERKLVRFLTTPRLHGIHHSNVREEADSNWSSGISLWDWLHGTIRVDVPQDAITVGVPAYPDAQDVKIEPSLRMPFQRQRNDWRTDGGPLQTREGHELNAPPERIRYAAPSPDGPDTQQESSSGP